MADGGNGPLNLRLRNRRKGARHGALHPLLRRGLEVGPDCFHPKRAVAVLAHGDELSQRAKGKQQA